MPPSNTPYQLPPPVPGPISVSTTHPPASAVSTPSPAFTPTQRSQQARNKPVNPPPSDTTNVNASRRTSGWRDTEDTNTLDGPGVADSYEQRQARSQAAEILDSVELLLWYSSARNESIPQTRRHFQNIFLGLSESISTSPEQDSPDSVAWKEEYEVPLEKLRKGVAPSPRGGASQRRTSAKGKEKEKEKDREKDRRKSSG
ncbi:hypothetical protein BCR34DRAFT_660046 [Clohesyomyces aquaticus]|uniref:Uncharacterized protein n=1 Tax=Clohesyomyces aquaticus TaxID=1231657 RepID=A0A1Y2A860_9PLEO|nr:hypothetical protein BCR34DRAFT_660046 [Clohesyomyces aquaticus]